MVRLDEVHGDKPVLVAHAIFAGSEIGCPFLAHSCIAPCVRQAVHETTVSARSA